MSCTFWEVSGIIKENEGEGYTTVAYLFNDKKDNEVIDAYDYIRPYKREKIREIVAYLKDEVEAIIKKDIW